MTSIGSIDSSAVSSTPPSSSPVPFFSALILSLPLIASEIFSAVQYASLISLISHSSSSASYGLSSVLFIGLVSSILTLIVSFLKESFSFFTPRLLIIGTEVLYTIGILLILVVDYQLSQGQYRNTAEFRTPYGFTIPGFLFTQLSVNVLQLVGRSLLSQRFSRDSQIAAHSWGGIFSLSASFLFKFSFGLAIRTGKTFVPATVQAVAGSFSGLGLLAATIGVVLIGPDDRPPAARRSLAALLGVDSFPDFFRISASLLVGGISAFGLDFITPVLAIEIGPDQVDDISSVDSFGRSYIGISIGCLVGVGGAILSRTRLGPRGTLVVGLFTGAVFAGLNNFSTAPASLAVLIVGAVLGGLAQGALAGAGWAALGISVPADDIWRYFGLFIGLNVALRGFAYFIAVLSANVLMPVVFIVAGILALNQPWEVSEGGGGGGYSEFGKVK